MTRPLRRLALAVFALAALAAARPAGATTYKMMSDESLADQATVVVDATVVGAASAPDGGRAPATDYRFDVDRVLKGYASGVLVVRVPGGLDATTGIGLKI